VVEVESHSLRKEALGVLFRHSFVYRREIKLFQLNKCKVPQEHRVRREFKEFRDLREFKVPPDCKGLREFKAYREFSEHKAPRESWDPRDRQERIPL
jgi:hypothetical protein